jgi:hypothetical protein
VVEVLAITGPNRGTGGTRHWTWDPCPSFVLTIEDMPFSTGLTFVYIESIIAGQQGKASYPKTWASR